MIVDRYPTPHTDRLFSRQAQIDSWTEITKHYATKDAANRNNAEAFVKINALRAPDMLAVATRENGVGHEIVAYLQLLEEQNPEIKQHLHVGLTSSDLVEYAWTVATEQHASIVVDKIGTLVNSLGGLPHMHRLSRTHGQVGWITTLRKQVDPTIDSLIGISNDLNRWKHIRPLKRSGPSGAFPVIGYRSVSVASVLNRTVVPSTQVLHRDHLLAWASLYLRLMCTLENLALQIRLGSRTDVGEVGEGLALHRAGSSAMPQKKNPIDSERVTGLARIARGNFVALAEGVALWEERDLSNSAPERIAVESMAGVAEYCLTTMNSLIETLNTHRLRADRNLMDHPEHRSHVVQYALQIQCGLGPTEASNFVKQHVAFSPEGRLDIEGSGWALLGDPELSLVDFLAFYEQTLMDLKP